MEISHVGEAKKGELERGRRRVRKERLEDPALRRRAGRGRGPRRRRKGGKPWEAPGQRGQQGLLPEVA